ncbi:MAG: DUF4270 family protein [Saprospiraceae bacterium]
MTHSIKAVPKYLLFIIACQFLIFSSCNKSNTLGSDLISNEWINAVGIDSFSFNTNSFIQDSIICAASGFPGTFFIGKIKDPIFGDYNSEIYSQLNFAVTREISFLHRTVDSVILSLRYDTASFFGNPQDLQSIKVFTLIDTLEVSKTYYCKDLKLKYSNDELGSLMNFKPNLSDSIHYKINNVDYSFAAQLRMNLDTSKFMSIMRNLSDTVFSNLNLFTKLFPGIAIVPDNTSSLMAFLASNLESRITIFYNSTDTTKAQFSFYFGPSRVSANSTDNTGSRVENYAKNIESGDSIAFIQGFTGADMRIKIPYQASWNNSLVNYAVLEINSPELTIDNTTYYKRPQLLVVKDYNSGRPVNIIDAAYGLSLNNFTDYQNFFGGNAKEITLNGEKVYQYKFNITGHFLQAKKSKKDIDIIISPLLKTERANRLIIGGNKNSKYPAKLRLVFSD